MLERLNSKYALEKHHHPLTVYLLPTVQVSKVQKTKNSSILIELNAVNQLFYVFIFCKFSVKSTF